MTRRLYLGTRNPDGRTAGRATDTPTSAAASLTRSDSGAGGEYPATRNAISVSETLEPTSKNDGGDIRILVPKREPGNVPMFSREPGAGKADRSTGFDKASGTGIMTPASKTINELEARHGEEIGNIFGIEPGALTASEAQYLLGFRTTDELRNRVAKARSERSARLRAKGVLPERQDSPGGVTPLFSRATSPLKLGQDRFADDIINQKSGTARPIDAVIKGITKAVRLDRLTEAAYHKAGALLDRYTPEAIKAGMISDYGIPEAVLDQRAVMQGRQRQKLRGAGALLDKLSTLTRAECRVGAFGPCVAHCCYDFNKRNHHDNGQRYRTRQTAPFSVAEEWPPQCNGSHCSWRRRQHFVT